MITRILLNITKHKVLNILLIFLLILSFVGITFSSVFVYKTSKFLNEIESAEDFIVISSREFSKTDTEAIEKLETKVYFDLYKSVESNDKVKTKLELFPFNLEIKEFQLTPEESESVEFTDYVSVTYYETEAENILELEDNYDTSKVYISEKVADKYGYGVGDKLNLIGFSNIGSITDASSIDYFPVKEVEIGGINQIYENAPEMIVYVPSNILINTEPENIHLGLAKIVITGTEEEISKVYEEVKEYSNSTYIYYSKDLESKELEFFVKIRNFFFIICISTLIVFAFSMLSLNNNIMERRTEEFRLYNVFGLEPKVIGLQLILEKVALLIMSLVISIPLFLFLLRVGNSVVDKLVEYTVSNEMILAKIMNETGSEEVLDTIYNGISSIEVSKILIIIFGIIAMFIIITIITIVQFAFRRSSIVNQRRGE